MNDNVKVKVAAVGDIHSPRYFDLFLEVVKDVLEADVFMLAGDVIHKGKVDEYPRILDALEEHADVPVIACFGNEEYEELYEELKGICSGRVIFLEEEAFVLNVKGVSLGIVGSKGSLDRPTWWQSKNMPGIRKVYAERAEKVMEAVLRLNTTYRGLLTHYAPTYCNLEGEEPSAWPEMASRKYEPVLEKVDFAVHGHAHKGKTFCEFKGAPVFNVALPATKRITVFEVPTRKVRLDAFFR
ncbi:MAG: metallophosphoesterase [Candidatus Freyarchaeota archaeon]|nr:metallophosphoesterase [Candidatus Jordarchaeia archaeon]